MESRTLALDEIIVDPSIQQRADGLSYETINEYTADYEKGDTLPPVDVFESKEGIYLADGFHRYEAHKSLGSESIDCTVHSGTRKDAIVFACAANAKNGLRRTNKDKQKAVRTLLEMFPKRSDRWVAEKAGVGNKFVGDVKNQVCSEHTSQSGGTSQATLVDDDEPDEPEADPEPETVIGKDGKKYPAKKPKDKPKYPLSDAFCKVLTDIVATLNSFRTDYGGICNLFAHERWDDDETLYVKQMIASLAKTFTDMNKEIKTNGQDNAGADARSRRALPK